MDWSSNNISVETDLSTTITVMKSRSITVWGIYSVWHRHAKVYQSTWLVNCLPPLLEPFIYLVAFGYGLTPLVGEVTYRGVTVNYLDFMAPGTMAIAVLAQPFVEGAYASFLRLNFQKTWHALLTAPLSFTEVFLGDWLWAGTKGVIAGILTGLVLVILGLYSGWHLLVSFPLIILGSLLFAGGGLLTAGCIQKVEQINIPLFLLFIPMLTICGTYFPRETLPPLLETVANILPLAPLVDLLRWPLGLSPFWPWILLYLLLWTGGLTLLAWNRIYPKLLQ